MLMVGTRYELATHPLLWARVSHAEACQERERDQDQDQVRTGTISQTLYSEANTHTHTPLKADHPQRPTISLWLVTCAFLKIMCRFVRFYGQPIRVASQQRCVYLFPILRERLPRESLNPLEGGPHDFRTPRRPFADVWPRGALTEFAPLVFLQRNGKCS